MIRRPPRSTLFPYTTLFRSFAGNLIPKARIDPSSQKFLAEMWSPNGPGATTRSEEHTSELQSLTNLVCRLLLEKKNEDRCRLNRLSDCPSYLNSLAYSHQLM